MKATLRLGPAGERAAIEVPVVPLGGPVQVRPLPDLSRYTTLHLYRGGGMGDVLFLAAAAYALFQDYPGIDVAIHTGSVLREVVDACVGVRWSDEDTEGIPLDWLVERSGHALSWDRVRIFADHLGADANKARLLVALSESALEWGAAVLENAVPENAIVVVPRTWCKSRCLAPRALEACCRAIISAGYTPVIMCAEPGPAPPGAIDMAGRFTLHAAAAIMAAADHVVSIDTGMLYLAAGMGMNCLGVFQTWPARLRAVPSDILVQTVEPDIECFPCYDPGGCEGETGARCSELIDCEGAIARLCSTSGL